MLQSIYARAEERFRNNNGTNIATGKARNDVLDAERQLYQSCRKMVEKSAALAQAIGLRLKHSELFQLQEDTPLPIQTINGEMGQDAILLNDPAVISTKEKITVAEKKLDQAQGAFKPTLSLNGRADYAGQDTRSWRGANEAIGYNSYRVGLIFQQPLFPLTSETAAVSTARAELEKAKATYEQAVITAGTQYQKIMSAAMASELSVQSAQRSLGESQRLLALSQQLYKAGRTDKDNVEHAQIDVEKSLQLVQESISDNNFNSWMIDRVLNPNEFAQHLLEQLKIESMPPIPN